jgi:periplasmic divalent cation tolerance protein
MVKRTPTRHVVVLVTCGSRREAAKIARRVVERRLAACVNVLQVPVLSLYRWKGKVERAREFLLLMKTSRSRLSALRAEVERLHSYDLPEFIALPIVSGSPRYLAWLEDCLRPK